MASRFIMGIPIPVTQYLFSEQKALEYDSMFAMDVSIKWNICTEHILPHSIQKTKHLWTKIIKENISNLQFCDTGHTVKHVKQCLLFTIDKYKMWLKFIWLQSKTLCTNLQKNKGNIIKLINYNGLVFIDASILGHARKYRIFVIQ